MWTPQQMNVFCQVPMVIPMQPLGPLTMQPLGSLAMPWPDGLQLPLEHNQPIDASNGEIVNIADDDEEEEDEESDGEELRTLFCANLDERVTEEILYEIFLQAGPVEVVRIPKDNQGKQRSFGFVTYVHAAAAPYAMQLYQGLELFRKRVTLRFRNSDRIPPNPYTLPLGLETQFGNEANRIAAPESNEQANKQSFANLNPFSQDLPNSLNAPNSTRNDLRDRLGRNSYHSAKPYDRPEEVRRRSDGMVDRVRDRHRAQNYHLSGNRRSEQRSGHHR